MLSCQGRCCTRSHPCAPSINLSLFCLLFVTPYVIAICFLCLSFCFFFSRRSFIVSQTAPCCTERSSSHLMSRCCAVSGLIFVRCTVVCAAQDCSVKEAVKTLFLSLSSSDCPALCSVPIFVCCLSFVPGGHFYLCRYYKPKYVYWSV